MKPIFKNTPLLLLSSLLFVSISVKGQSENEFSGAWQSQDGDKKTVLLIQDHYFTQSIFKADEYIMSYGGPFSIENKRFQIKVEFNSDDSVKVGETATADFLLKNNKLQITLNSKSATYERMDNGKAPLAGVWHITDRMQEGKLVPIQRSGTRKTLKVLTASRFQWFAIDPGTKQFFGTGGGTYSFVDGTYTEHIEFFSRDNSRVGANLSFDGKLTDGKWHHSGLSSKGDKIYEIWGKVDK